MFSALAQPEPSQAMKEPAARRWGRAAMSTGSQPHAGGQSAFVPTLLTILPRLAENQIIGRTGETGLAIGDHLHYGVYVSGVPVRPEEWWDAQQHGDQQQRWSSQGYVQHADPHGTRKTMGVFK